MTASGGEGCDAVDDLGGDGRAAISALTSTATLRSFSSLSSLLQQPGVELVLLGGDPARRRAPPWR